MEELGWHKPLMQIQRSGRTAFFSSLFFFPLLLFFPWRGFKALLQGVAFPRYFIPSAYFSVHQVSVVHIHPSVPGDGCVAAEISSLGQRCWLNKTPVAWSCNLQKNPLSRPVWSQQRVLTKSWREFWQLEPPTRAGTIKASATFHTLF